MRANAALLVSLAFFVLVITYLGMEKITNSDKCLAYEKVTGRETTYTSKTCFIRIDNSFYTQEEFKYLLRGK